MVLAMALLAAWANLAPAVSLETTQAAAAAAPVPVSGTVRDGSGLPIAGATIALRGPAGPEVRGVSGPDGTFSLATTSKGPLEVTVRAGGFAEVQQTIGEGASRVDLMITLTPASIAEAVTVTPSRSEQRMTETPASVNVIDRKQIRQSAAVVADDILRQVPTFSLFRRTSSLAAHPTSQGVSLRGIGPSGVSRTLVLLDGVPFNDPFGGWVYWTRVPLESTDRIEIVDGSTSSLYGNYAMGGVVNVVTTRPARRTVESRVQFGNRSTPRFDLRGSDVWGKLGVVAEGTGFDTDGYAIVAPNERGAVDTKAAVNFKNANVGLHYDITDRIQATFRTGYFREKRDNAKVSTIDGTPEANDTTWKSVSGGVRAQMVRGGEIQANLFGDVETFHSNFLAVPAATPPRSLGRMTLNQTVPTTGVGTMTQWSKAFGRRNVVSAGLDWRQVKGDSQEDGLDATSGTSVILHRVSGGRQRSVGLFIQDIVSVTDRFTLTLSVRGDHWKNYDGHNLENNVPSGSTTPNNVPSYPDRTDKAASPKLGALYRLTDRVSVWGSAGAGFRAPTLNELYRQFRVGTVLTLANNLLGPERLVGGEAGVRFEPVRNLTARVTWFDNEVKDPVSNVTITQSGANVTQQRQNLGRTEIWGVQNDVEYRIGEAWRVTGGYLYNHATVTDNPANIALVGKFLPQVPMHRGSVGVAYSNPRLFDFFVDVQALGLQYDDDLNARVVPGYTDPGLPKYAVVSFQASRSFGRSLEVFVGAQNLFDQISYVGTFPTTIGTPRLVNAGVRVKVSGK